MHDGCMQMHRDLKHAGNYMVDEEFFLFHFKIRLRRGNIADACGCMMNACGCMWMHGYIYEMV